MATTVHLCEMYGCKGEVLGPEVRYCDWHQAEIDRRRQCPLCGIEFDPGVDPDRDGAVCCRPRVLTAFYRGEELSDAALEWVYRYQGGATLEHREIARMLAAKLQRADESVSYTYEAPHHTRWETPDGLVVNVAFSTHWSRTEAVVETIEIGDQYGGVTADKVRAVLAAVAGEAR